MMTIRVVAQEDARDHRIPVRFGGVDEFEVPALEIRWSAPMPVISLGMKEVRKHWRSSRQAMVVRGTSADPKPGVTRRDALIAVAAGDTMHWAVPAIEERPGVTEAKTTNTPEFRNGEHQKQGGRPTGALLGVEPLSRFMEGSPGRPHRCTQSAPGSTGRLGSWH